MIPTHASGSHARPYRLFTALFETVTLYGLLGWVYVAAFAVAPRCSGTAWCRPC